MRFADFVIALPFLLFMILFKIAFGIGPGESRCLSDACRARLAWVACDCPARTWADSSDSAGRLHLGIAASWAKAGYLVLRHMIPHAMGVILVTLTFAVPSAIFTEAFLSFIGMGLPRRRRRGAAWRTKAFARCFRTPTS